MLTPPTMTFSPLTSLSSETDLTSLDLNSLHVLLLNLEERRDSFLEDIPETHRSFIEETLAGISKLRQSLCETILTMFGDHIVEQCQDHPSIISQIIKILLRELDIDDVAQLPLEFRERISRSFQRRCDEVMSSYQSETQSESESTSSPSFSDTSFQQQKC
ncbi:hypothetical protein GEMRC1_011920 [Eukaryota sp. GEM-RC1]